MNTQYLQTKLTMTTSLWNLILQCHEMPEFKFDDVETFIITNHYEQNEFLHLIFKRVNLYIEFIKVYSLDTNSMVENSIEETDEFLKTLI